ncbi:MAG TPA: hypothetical protein VMK05_00550 [Burkholderiales bacterium]|nr:hypothetical protein [Burkholderiales bacterium]
MKHFITIAAALSLVASTSFAADLDTGRATGLFDQRPQCMDRDAVDNPDCVAPSDQTGHRHIFVGPNVPPMLQGSSPVATSNTNTPATAGTTTQGAPNGATQGASASPRASIVRRSTMR